MWSSTAKCPAKPTPDSDWPLDHVFLTALSWDDDVIPVSSVESPTGILRKNQAQSRPRQASFLACHSCPQAWLVRRAGKRHVVEPIVAWRWLVSCLIGCALCHRRSLITRPLANGGQGCEIIFCLLPCQDRGHRERSSSRIAQRSWTRQPKALNETSRAVASSRCMQQSPSHATFLDARGGVVSRSLLRLHQPALPCHLRVSSEGGFLWADLPRSPPRQSLSGNCESRKPSAWAKTLPPSICTTRPPAERNTKPDRTHRENSYPRSRFFFVSLLPRLVSDPRPLFGSAAILSEVASSSLHLKVWMVQW